MKIKIVSDLHTEFHAAYGDNLCKNIQNIKKSADVLIIAGDLGTKKTLEDNFNILCGEFEHIIYVAGNHEYYGTTKEYIHDILRDTMAKNKNFHWLERGFTTINNQKFVGCTLWFKFDKDNSYYKKGMNDFYQILEFEKWVYSVNNLSIRFLENHMDKDSIVITHHIPTWDSVSPEYVGSTLNRFFMCDIKKIIEDKQPKIFVHGHTHQSFNYKIGVTSVIANPFGYFKVAENPDWDENLVVEV